MHVSAGGAASGFSSSLSSRSKMDPLPWPGSNQLTQCARHRSKGAHEAAEGEESEEERAHLF